MIRIVNHILIHIIIESLPFVFPIPTEVFIGGVEDHLAPTIENHDFKITDLTLYFFSNNTIFYFTDKMILKVL